MNERETSNTEAKDIDGSEDNVVATPKTWGLGVVALVATVAGILAGVIAKAMNWQLSNVEGAIWIVLFLTNKRVKVTGYAVSFVVIVIVGFAIAEILGGVLKR